MSKEAVELMIYWRFQQQGLAVRVGECMTVESGMSITM